MTPEESLIVKLLTAAWLLPLVGFVIEIFGGYWQRDRKSKAAASLAVACIGAGFVFSAIALAVGIDWSTLLEDSHTVHAEEHADGEQDHHSASGRASHEHETEAEHAAEAHPVTLPISGTLYLLADFDSLQIGIDYYIDSLTLVMFAMVTLIATCIHVFSMGYMSDELTDDHADHQVHVAGGGHFHRPGRFYKFFAYMSLFSFSMLGLVYAGNIFQVFVFWELVGLCSYLLIGFYYERKSASNAANKAFIVNRVGDFGFLVGLMILWTSFGTFRFFDHEVQGQPKAGLFQMVRGEDGQMDVDREAGVVYLKDTEGYRISDSQEQHAAIPYWLLVAAGIGVFAGCIGKSAQFPLQTWLPDAMEGPTPVSALVHSATMVAAGVYLAGRFYPMFTPEVLLVIAYVGCITLFLAATIAIVATDIKRVLAYSTISQLGYMMLGLGVFGWGAGLFHLITHAFFKSLMFLASGSVIVACHHEQEMPRMGGLRKKMPITAYTMLVGVIAICGLAIPGITIFGEPIAFSGYHSKDAIVATSLAYMNRNPIHFLLFVVPLITAGITAFYMFRLWFMTFCGRPRDAHLYEHAEETAPVMTVPLIVLAFFAAFCALGGEGGPLFGLLAASEPVHVAQGITDPTTSGLLMPTHDLVVDAHEAAGAYALLAAIVGAALAYVFYGARLLDPAEIKRSFAGLYGFLVEKWRFDELYDVMFVRPVHVVAGWCAVLDRRRIDGLLHWLSRRTVDVSEWDRRFDEGVIDGAVNWIADVTYALGRSLRNVQTGYLRDYITFIALGVLALFLLLFMLFPT